MARKKIDYGKLAMYGAGGVLLYLLFRPRKARAAKPMPPAGPGRPTPPPPAPTPEPGLLIPRFTREDGRCVDNLDLTRPKFVDESECERCDDAEPSDPYCYPEELQL